MSLGFGRVGVVRIVGCEEGRTDLDGDLNQIRQYLALCRDPVVLNLNKEIVATENVLVHPGCFLGSLVVPTQAGVPFLARGVGAE